ncbi:TrkH-domain-containing protein [Colletotrichum zoysiae]|uniref:TrkH-domain-containing protein n=1 Tax=Colletotrichum zoysiae TaxID=1216348 RepID=A0AAD9HUF7_9PEZI|nr:TrkH-domain-containing protein [Colletotrichum zoysiae]
MGRYLPPLNFITLHYAYFIVVCLLASVIFWRASDPSFKVSYTDSLFLVVSAMTEAGLNTVNLSQLTTWQQTILFLLLLLGSTIWVSIWTVLARKYFFEKRFDEIVRAERARKLSRQGSTLSLAIPRLPLNLPKLFHRRSKHSKRRVHVFRRSLPFRRNVRSNMPSMSHPNFDEPLLCRTANTILPHITFDDTPHPNTTGPAASKAVSISDGRAAFPPRGANKTPTDLADVDLDARHFLRHHSDSRNNQLHSLSSAERGLLGGCEYRALKVLALLVPVYFFIWQLLGCIALGAWINNYMPDTARANGINPWWLGIFNCVSAFNNSGMSLLDANMIPFQGAYYVLITMGLLILAGNTAYPLFLRLIIWSSLKILNTATPQDALNDLKATLEFILKHPRRVYTNLFPSRPTWWLFFMLLCLNSVDWVAFEILNIGNSVIEKISVGSRVIDGLFQALAVRSGGFYVVPISGLFIGLQLLYVTMMYISVYPVVITMRHSNVYEERSLGIYSGDVSSTSEEDPEAARAFKSTFMSLHGVGATPPKSGTGGTDPNVPESRISFISQQVREQLAHDLWWLALAVLIITIIETSKFIQDPVTFSVFNIIFEVVSAYGTVGISVGIPTDAYSFCGAWNTGSKIILCLVMLRGRHRGLPVALDHAVRLPGPKLHRDEEEDYHIRRSRTMKPEQLKTII